jgi:hypothetical protein
MDRAMLLGPAGAANPSALQGIFSPPSGAAREKGSVLSTFRGWDLKGKGQDRMLGWFQKAHLITQEQRAAGGPVGAAAQGAVEATADAGFSVGASTAGAGTAVGRAGAGVGIYEQLMAQRGGFVFPVASAAEEELPMAAAPVATQAAEAVADAAPEVATAAPDASAVASLEQQFIDRLQQVAKLPEDQHLQVLARAVDAGATDGLGDDARSVLIQALGERPLEHSVGALDAAIKAAAPAVADTVEHAAAPVVEQAAEQAAKGAAEVAPSVVERAAPAVTEALHGLSFSAGLDMTQQLLAHVRL